LSFSGETLTQALELREGDPVRAIALLREVLSDPASTAEVVRVKEQAIVALADLLSQEGKAEVLLPWVQEIGQFMVFELQSVSDIAYGLCWALRGGRKSGIHLSFTRSQTPLLSLSVARTLGCDSWW
jgi:hypothetical protein